MEINFTCCFLYKPTVTTSSTPNLSGKHSKQAIHSLKCSRLVMMMIQTLFRRAVLHLSNKRSSLCPYKSEQVNKSNISSQAGYWLIFSDFCGQHNMFTRESVSFRYKLFHKWDHIQWFSFHWLHSESSHRTGFYGRMEKAKMIQFTSPIYHLINNLNTILLFLFSSIEKLNYSKVAEVNYSKEGKTK